MIHLRILFADGSLYWKENFLTMVALNKWLDEEKTRPYWKKDFKIEIIDRTPAPMPPEKLAKLEAQTKKFADASTELELLLKKSGKDPAVDFPVLVDILAKLLLPEK